MRNRVTIADRVARPVAIVGRAVRPVAVVGVVLGLMAGAGAPAAAQPGAAGSPSIPPGAIQAIPGMPDLSPILPSLPESTGKRAELGRANLSLPFVGAVYDATLNKQVVAGQRVIPGGLVTVRLEVAGNGGHTFVRELRNIMPAGFELVSVMRMKDNALGQAAHVLAEEEYEVVERGSDGLREVVVSWSEDGFLGLYRDNPRIEKGGSVVVDFVYRAPMEPGDYEHGGTMRVSTVAGVAPKIAGGDKGGVPVNVGLVPENLFGSLEGYGGGSI